MPTLLFENGFRFFFYSNEPEFKPPHVHVKYQSEEAIFWLAQVSLAQNKRMKPKNIAKALDIIIKNRTFFLEKYYEQFGIKN